MEAIELAFRNNHELIYIGMQMSLVSGGDAGCYDFLIKPVPREKLYAMTSRYQQSAKRQEIFKTPIVSSIIDEDPAFKELLLKWVSEVPEMLGKLTTFYEQQNWGARQGELHHLKGMGGGFAYRILREVAGIGGF